MSKKLVFRDDAERQCWAMVYAAVFVGRSLASSTTEADRAVMEMRARGDAKPRGGPRNYVHKDFHNERVQALEAEVAKLREEAKVHNA